VDSRKTVLELALAALAACSLLLAGEASATEIKGRVDRQRCPHRSINSHPLCSDCVQASLGGVLPLFLLAFVIFSTFPIS
jgi:hypothetical protein